jgi:hypothetical protein
MSGMRCREFLWWRRAGKTRPTRRGSFLTCGRRIPDIGVGPYSGRGIACGGDSSRCRHSGVTAMDGGNTGNAGAVSSESWNPAVYMGSPPAMLLRLWCR